MKLKRYQVILDEWQMKYIKEVSKKMKILSVNGRINISKTIRLMISAAAFHDGKKLNLKSHDLDTFTYMARKRAER